MSFGICFSELNSKILFATDKRYIKVVSDDSSMNWGGILLATKTNVLLVSFNGRQAPEIVWSAISPTDLTVNSGENNPLETIIDTNSAYSHIFAIPFGSIGSRARITFTD